MNLEFAKGGRRFRFFDRFDEPARRFEDELRAVAMSVGALPWPRLSHPQSYRHLDGAAEKFFVLQMQGARARFQICVVEHASRLPWFKTGIAPYWIPAAEPEAREDQEELLGTLRELCRTRTSLMSVRAHAYTPGDEALAAAQALLARAGFTPCEPQAPERTRLVDLAPPLAELLASFPGKTRRWLTIQDPAAARAAELSDRRLIPALRAALDDSFSRSTGERVSHDFEALFSSLERHPGSAAVVGFFLAAEPDAPLAFASAVSHGPVFEYATAGSRSSEALRKLPFNYVLLWRLIELAKARGARLFDLGGITDQGPDDPLAGISHFKRRFPGFETSVGREALLELRPLRRRLFTLLQAGKKCLR